MAKQLLFNPRVLINYAEFLLSVDIEVICALLIEEFVLGIKYFKATSHIVIL